MVLANKDRCIGCGACVRICHEHCIILVEDTVRARGVPRVDHNYCSTCTQCTEYLKAQPKLERAPEAGCAYPSPPAAFVFLVDDRRTPLARDSAQYALYNLMLYAQAKGVGCRNLVGNQMIFSGSKAVRRCLGLKKAERIYSTVGLGVPAVRFRNKVEGRTLPVQWNGGERI